MVAATSTYEETRQRHIGHAMSQLGALMARLEWDRAEIDSAREQGLRAAVASARRDSPWHAGRLGGIDAGRLTVEGLKALPVMTKEDLMSNWDGIVSDRSVNLRDAEAHLGSLLHDDYYRSTYHVVASGGSSGRRGVFAWDWDGWALTYLGFLRWSIRATVRRGLAADKQVVGQVAAEKPTHMTSAVSQTFTSQMAEMHRFPVTMPIASIVEGLNGIQPTLLSGYPSILNELAREARAGRLNIAPHAVTATSEPLLPDVRAALAEAWGAPVMNWWGTSEGGANGASCGFGDGMHLAEDMHIIEFVDNNYEPVPIGEAASRILLTNLINPLMPLIRYEITDEVRMLPEPCPCGSAFARVADIQGRTDDCLVYEGGIVVHPHVFRSPLARDASVLEYQVRQTRDGAEIDVRTTSSDADLEGLRGEIVEHLRAVGLGSPQVAVRRVDAIARTSAGKLARFVPLKA